MKMNTKFLILLLAVFLTLTACAPIQAEPIESVAEDVLPPASTEIEESESESSENALQASPFPTETQAPQATSTAEPEPTTESVFEIVTAPALTQFEMIDFLNGWGQAEGMILRTEDGGETWLNITPENVFGNPIYAPSFFLDAKTGWILIVDDEDYSRSVLYKTADGGTTWAWRNMPFGRATIGFLDAQNGYGLENLGAGAGSNGVAIWTTQNSGDDYNRVFLHEPGYDASLPLGGMKSGISFIDSQNGWVTGSQPQDGYIWLYRTLDGGFSWEHQDLTLPELYEEAQTYVFSPIFFDDGMGVLPVYLYSEESATVFYRTLDGGENWQATSPILQRGKYDVISSNEIILWDGSTFLFFTLDGGETWQPVPSEWLPYELRSLDFIDILNGWALADDGLYRTENGGLTWTKLGE